MKWDGRGFTWGGPDDDWYWIYIFNWLPADIRYLGYEQDWYDHPISSLGFWFFNITWYTPWTRHDGQGGWSISRKK